MAINCIGSGYKCLERYSSNNPNAYRVMNGGKRAGAGRKPMDWHKFAERVLEQIEPEKRILQCLITNRILGNPARMVIGDSSRPVAVQLLWGAGVFRLA